MRHDTSYFLKRVSTYHRSKMNFIFRVKNFVLTYSWGMGGISLIQSTHLQIYIYKGYRRFLGLLYSIWGSKLPKPSLFVSMVSTRFYN